MKEQIQKWLDSNYKNYQRKNPNGISQGEVDHIVDWMKSPEAVSYLARLDRVSVPAALDLANRWTEKMNKKNAKALAIESDRSGVEVVYSFPDGYDIVKLKSKESFQMEGVKMGHCVGGYFNDYESNGDFEIYSLRGPDNEPHCTIEFTKSTRFIEQIKGKANAPVVEKYHPYVVKFLNQFDFDGIYTHDIKNINAIYFGNYVFWNEEIPKTLEIKKTLTIDQVNYIHTFDSLTVRGDIFLTKNRRCKKIASTLIVEGDVVIEEFHGLLKLADKLIVKGSIEIEDCENLKLLADEIQCESAFISACPHFKKVKTSFEMEVA